MWCVCGACVMRVWCVCGVCVVCVWCVCGACVVRVWCMCGACVVRVWCMCGACVVRVWCVCGACVVRVWCSSLCATYCEVSDLVSMSANVDFVSVQHFSPLTQGLQTCVYVCLGEQGECVDR